MIHPVNTSLADQSGVHEVPVSGNYFAYFMQTIPSSIMQPFVEGHVIGVLFLAVTFSLAVLVLPSDQRSFLHSFFRVSMPR